MKNTETNDRMKVSVAVSLVLYEMTPMIVNATKL